MGLGHCRYFVVFDCLYDAGSSCQFCMLLLVDLMLIAIGVWGLTKYDCESQTNRRFPRRYGADICRPDVLGVSANLT